MRLIHCPGLLLNLLLFYGSSLRAEELTTLTQADEKLLERLLREFLFDPQGAERVAVNVPNRTKGYGKNLEITEGWCVRGTMGKPDVVHFTDGTIVEVQPQHELQKVDFLAACRGRYITEPPSPLDDKQLQEFRKRGADASRGLIDEHDAALAAWLYRLGEPQLAAVALRQARQNRAGEPSRSLREHLAQQLYTRVFRCYLKREDELALAAGELLVQRYHECDPDSRDPTVPSLVDELRRRKKLQRFGKPAPELRPHGYEQWPIEKKVAYQIDTLDEVDAQQFSNPGAVHFDWDPRVKELVQLGDAAVPALIETLEKDERLTRSADFGRTYYPTGELLGVREPAFAALNQILRIPFPVHETKNSKAHNLTELNSEYAKQLAAFAREHWAKYGQFPKEERMLKWLRQAATPQEQLAAAENLADLGTDSQLSRIVPRNSTSAKRHEPVVESLLKIENPTVAEAIFAALEQTGTIRGESTPDGRMYARQAAETSFLPCLVKLGDRRIAPKIRERLREPTTPLERLELCVALHYLGDSEPLTEWCDEFRQGKLQFAPPAEPRFVWPKPSNSYAPSSSFYNSPPGLIMVRDLSRANLPAADAALEALAEKNHPQYKLAAEYYQGIEAYSSRAEILHPFGLKFLCDGLEDRTPTDTSAEVRGKLIKYITNPKNDWGEELPDYLADPAQRQESVMQRRCDIFGRHLSNTMFGGPRYHPLLKDPDARLAELKLYHDRHGAKFRRLEWFEIQALRLSPSSSLFIPNYAVLKDPATPADVAAGRAMFTLGEKAVLAGLKLPAVAALTKDQALPNPPRVLIVQAEVDAAGKTSYGVIGIGGLQVLNDDELVNIESIEVP